MGNKLCDMYVHHTAMQKHVSMTHTCIYVILTHGVAFLQTAAWEAVWDVMSVSPSHWQTVNQMSDVESPVCSTMSLLIFF